MSYLTAMNSIPDSVGSADRIYLFVGLEMNFTRWIGVYPRYNVIFSSLSSPN